MIQESDSDQQIQNRPDLPIELIVVPQYDESKLVNGTNYNLNDPINVKIKIRNKEEKGEKFGLVSAPKISTNIERKVRLVNSDQTIMSFDLCIEPDKNKKYHKKAHKNFFHFFKPRRCLRIQNDDDDNTSYLPADKINSTSSIVETDIPPEKNVLKKNFVGITSSARTEKPSKVFMGKCKPGGCLDPPFSEDKYSYEQTLKLSTTSFKYTNDEEFLQVTSSLHRKSEEKIQGKEKTNKFVKSQIGNDFSDKDYEDSLITYPISCSSQDFEVHKENAIQFKSRISSENKARLSINEFSEIFFMPPKKEKTKRIENVIPKKISMVQDETDLDSKKSSCSSLKQEQLELCNILVESKNAVNNNIGESELVIETSNSINEINGVNHNSSIIESEKSVESVQNVRKPKAIIFSADNTDASHIAEPCFKDVLNKEEVSNSQNNTHGNESAIHTEYCLKDTELFSTKYKDSNKNESGEVSNIVNFKSPSLKILDVQNITSDNTANQVNKTNEPSYFFEESIKKIKRLTTDHEENVNIENMETPSLKSKELDYVDFHNSANDDANFAICCKIKQDESDLNEFEEIRKIDRVALNSKEIQNKNSTKHPVLVSKEFDDSLKVFHDSFEKELKHITKATVESNNKSNFPKNNILNNDIIQVKDLQYSNKISQEYLLKNSVDISNITEANKTSIASDENLGTNTNRDNTFILPVLVSKEFEHSLKGFHDSFEKELKDITKAIAIKGTPLESNDKSNYPRNNILNNDIIQVKELQYLNKSSQEYLLKNCVDISNISEVNKTFIASDENLGTNTNIDNTFIPPALVSKEFEDSFNGYHDSFEKELQDITKAIEIKVTPLESNDKSNFSKNNILNNDIIQVKELQYSIKKSRESLLRNSVNTPNINDINKTFMVNDANLGRNRNIDNSFIPREEQTLALASNDAYENFETFLKTDEKVSDDYKTVISSDEIAGTTGEEQISNITLRQENTYYAEEHDDKNITVANLLLTASAEILRQTPHVASIGKKLSSDFLIGGEIKKKYFSTTSEERKNNNVENLKFLASFESVKKVFDSNKKAIEKDEGLTGNYGSETSLIPKNLTLQNHSKQSSLLKIKVKSSSQISNVNDNNSHQPNINLINTDHENYSNSMDLTNLQDLQKNILNVNQLDDRDQTHLDTDNKYKSYHEDFTPTYSSIAVDFGFRYIIDKDNKLTIQTVDTSTALNKRNQDNISIIKSIIRSNDDEIRIPINFNTDLAIQIKGRITSEAATSQSQCKLERNLIEISRDRVMDKDDYLQETLNSVYKNLVPINTIIQNLREEANTLSRQQSSLKEILELMQMKPMRLVRTNANCGCEKK